jgi:hypothetical protein
MAKKRLVKRGPHKKRRRCRFRIIDSWDYCERCEAHRRTFPNRTIALRALPMLWDPSLACVNRFGGVHLAVA